MAATWVTIPSCSESETRAKPKSVRVSQFVTSLSEASRLNLFGNPPVCLARVLRSRRHALRDRHNCFNACPSELFNGIRLESPCFHKDSRTGYTNPDAILIVWTRPCQE